LCPTHSDGEAIIVHIFYLVIFLNKIDSQLTGFEGLSFVNSSSSIRCNSVRIRWLAAEQPYHRRLTCSTSTFLLSTGKKLFWYFESSLAS
jgi:hypothetical protein